MSSSHVALQCMLSAAPFIKSHVECDSGRVLFHKGLLSVVEGDISIYASPCSWNCGSNRRALLCKGLLHAQCPHVVECGVEKWFFSLMLMPYAQHVFFSSLSCWPCVSVQGWVLPLPSCNSRVHAPNLHGATHSNNKYHYPDMIHVAGEYHLAGDLSFAVECNKGRNAVCSSFLPSTTTPARLIFVKRSC